MKASLTRQLKLLRMGHSMVKLVLSSPDSSAAYVKPSVNLLPTDRYLFIAWGINNPPRLSAFHFSLPMEQAKFIYFTTAQFQKNNHWVEFVNREIFNFKPSLVVVLCCLETVKKDTGSFWKKLAAYYPSSEEKRMVMLRDTLLKNEKVVQELKSDIPVIEAIYDSKSSEVLWDLSRQIEA
jgi:hypothetical protein